MKYCKTCEISYDTPLDKCLLCNDALESETNNEIYKFAPFKKKSRFTTYFIRGLFLANLMTIIISVFIDYLIDKTLSWSLIVSVSNIYLIIFVNLLLNHTKFIFKLFWIIIISIIELIMIGYLTSDPHWALDIVLPFSLMFNTLILIVFTLAKRKRWQDYTMFLFLSILANMGLILLPILKLTKTNWPFIVSFFLGLFTLLGFLIFTPKNVKEEFLRRFHT